MVNFMHSVLSVRTRRRLAGHANSARMPTSQMPCRLPRPGNGEAHVWTLWLPDVLPGLPAMEPLLAIEEARKAGRFVRSEDRSRYIAAHGILRQMLGRYLSAAPADLRFVSNDCGKPALDQPGGMPPLSFNMAHSGEVLLYVVASDHRVGVDVEAIRTDLEVMELARNQFAPQETKTLQAITRPERTEAFFRCWTRKEAYVKARGEGLGVPLKQFAVSFKQGDPPGVQWAADDPAASERWSMFDLVPAPGYAGAVVVEGRPVTLVTRRWEYF